jgi:hypothetical protein
VGHFLLAHRSRNRPFGRVVSPVNPFQLNDCFVGYRSIHGSSQRAPLMQDARQRPVVDEINLEKPEVLAVFASRLLRWHVNAPYFVVANSKLVREKLSIVRHHDTSTVGKWGI